MLFAICADRGAPGSTTAALALASARGLQAIVVEADPYGGDLALRLKPDGKHPLAATPTVLSVAAGRSAEQRHVPTSTPMRQLDLWRSGSHELSEHVRVVPGFMNAEQGAAVAWSALASVLQSQTVPVFADVGRIHTGSPSMPILTAADAVIAVCRGDMGSVHHMIERLEALAPAIAERTGRPPRFLPMVVAPRQHGSHLAQAVSQMLGASAVGPAVRYVGWLAWDPAGCALLEDGGDPWAKATTQEAADDLGTRVPAPGGSGYRAGARPAGPGERASKQEHRDDGRHDPLQRERGPLSPAAAGAYRDAG